MNKAPKVRNTRSSAGSDSPLTSRQSDFDVVLSLIEAARTTTVRVVNTRMIDLYWKIGEYINRKIDGEEWGKGTVKALAEYIRHRQPGTNGFSASNLWRMRQFFETYREEPKLATMSRELSWSHNLW
jgi:hypothetical protein